jgi:hypothetical protein
MDFRVEEVPREEATAMEHNFMVEFRNVLNRDHDVRIVRIDRMKAALTPDTPARLTHSLPPARRGIMPSSYAFTLTPSSTDLFRSNMVRAMATYPLWNPKWGEADDAVALAEAKKLLERNGVETDEPSPVSRLLTFTLPPCIRFLLKSYQLGMTCRHSNLRVAMETPQNPGSPDVHVG